MMTTSRSKPKDIPPAVAAVREVTRRFPNKIIWDMIVEKIGDNPDIERLTVLYKQWVAAGRNPVSIGWLDKYCPAIPKEEGTPCHEAALWNSLMEAAKSLPPEIYGDRGHYDKVKRSFVENSANRKAAEDAIEAYENSREFEERFRNYEKIQIQQ